MVFCKELAAVVLKKFGVDLIDSTELSLGFENLNLKVETCKGTFVLRQWTNSKQENISFELGLLKHLYKNGFPVPEQLKSTDGKDFVAVEGKSFGLFKYLEGQTLEPSQFNCEQLRELGKTLAEMQLALKDCKPNGKSNIGDLFDFSFDYSVLRSDFPKIGPKFKKTSAILKKALECIEPELNRLKNCPNYGPIHNDFFYWNFKYNGNKISAILDFGDACIGSWASDLATTLSDMAIGPKKTELEAISEIFSAYCKKVKLTQTEKKAIPLLMLHRALRVPLFDVNCSLLNPCNKEKYFECLSGDLKRIRQLQKTLPEIEAAFTKV